jgi:hypothetical protein
MLGAIPGISRSKAAVVVQHYPSLGDLMRVYKSNQISQEEKIKLLKDLEIESSAGQNARKFGPVLSERVYTVFNSKDPNEIVYQ